MDISNKDLQLIRDSLYVAELALKDGTPIAASPESSNLRQNMDAVMRIRKEIESRLSYIKTFLDI